ncbi:MAG: DMT family transporter [Candidatus Kariarchaeaceae archaeon]
MSISSDKSHLSIVFQGILVTILWSSSFVIIKFGLDEIPPITYAALRYSSASIVLIGLMLLSPNHRTEVRNLSLQWWGRLAVYGLIYYTITMATMYIALNKLAAITVSFVLNFTIIFVIIFATFTLHEVPNIKQLIFIIVSFSGMVLYFYPISVLDESRLGLIIITISMLANAISAILGRMINRVRTQSPLVITTLSMTFGSISLLLWSLISEGTPSITVLGIVYILWLAVVNTALAFTLWNKVLRHLNATEVTIINGLMLPEIAIFAIIFLDEMPNLSEWIGIAVITFSGLAIQFFRDQSN